jgi:enamine deaminase RidA (YjgF/YER057c/UK114 family)
MGPEERLKHMGIELPAAPAPVGSYAAAARSGNLIFISGMLPLRDGRLARTGKVGEGVSPEEAREDARAAALNALAVLKEHAGSLNSVAGCVKVTGYIASTRDFIEQPAVLNGASNLMVEVFGDAGRHARAALSVPVLPLDSPVEIEFIFELKDG